jgi:hypothetical protein
MAAVSGVQARAGDHAERRGGAGGSRRMHASSSSSRCPFREPESSGRTCVVGFVDKTGWAGYVLRGVAVARAHASDRAVPQVVWASMLRCAHAHHQGAREKVHPHPGWGSHPWGGPSFLPLAQQGICWASVPAAMMVLTAVKHQRQTEIWTLSLRFCHKGL